MTQKELLKEINKSFKESYEIIKKKNSDYSKEKDPFLNFRFAEFLGTKPELGILLRMGDKLIRIANIINKGEARVKDESVEDSLNDIANYAMLLKIFLKNEKK